jgi:hypothetical protein
MNIEGKTVWQQAAGDTNRDYVKLCLDWGVILNGPGYLGPWPECREPLLAEEWSKHKLSDLQRFCEDMKDGDIVVLRLGTSSVYGVGVIAEEYEWQANFGDVDGWDLQHVRRVRWVWQEEKSPSFKTYALKFGDTTQKLNEGEVLDWLKELPVSKTDIDAPLPDLPVTAAEEVTIEDMAEFLFEEGVADDSISNLTKVVGELGRIANWYDGKPNPSESETIAYLAVPLLRALGWTPQKMAIEWNRLDLALFRTLPRGDNSLAVVVEAKKKGQSCLSALWQAEGYAGQEGREGCRKIIVTDGLRYGIFKRSGEGFQLYAYVNLTRLRSNYPIYDCRGANEGLLAMTPESAIAE